jgi:hypothetical protein
MSDKTPFENFDIEEFKAQEFPKPTGKYPDVDRLINHLDRITGLLSECAGQSVKNCVSGTGDNIYILHTNTRYTIAWNFRLRTLSLIKIFSEIEDVEGNLLFDEGTATIILRSLLESYLVYYQLYNLNQSNPDLQKIYFNMYDLSSRLQFLRSTKNIKGLNNPPEKDQKFKSETDQLIIVIINDESFASLPVKIQQAIKRIKEGKQDYLSFVNFTALIKASPLPNDFIGDYYSQASAIAHSEGFSARMSLMVFESRDKWNSLNELLKFRLIYFALSISSQFFISFIQYDRTELDDEKEKDLCEVLILVDFYLKALASNK